MGIGDPSLMYQRLGMWPSVKAQHPHLHASRYDVAMSVNAQCKDPFASKYTFVQVENDLSSQHSGLVLVRGLE